jgi:parallel beta-helix repeat protein
MTISESRWRVVFVASVLLLILFAPSLSLPEQPDPARTALHGLATLTAHTPIQIIGNEAFTKANGVVAGTGSPSNPYLIENWNISYSSTVGIWVESTTAYFVIMHDEVCCGAGATGIVLTNVTNGSVAWSNVTSTNINGIELDGDTNVGVTGGNVSSSNSDTAAIETSLSSGVNVSLVSLSSPGGWGIWAGNVRGLDIWDDAPRAPMGHGINVSASQGVRILDTNATAQRSGIELWLDTDVLVENDEAYTSQGNTAQDSGLRIVGSSWVNVSGNRFGTASTVPGSGPAVHIEGNSVAFSRNTLTSSGSSGIDIEGGATDISVIANRVVAGKGYGLIALGAREVTLTGNTFSGNASGLLLDKSQSVDLEGNTLSSRGLVLKGALAADYDTHTIPPNNTVGGKPIVYARNCTGSSLDGIAAGQIIVANCTDLRIANVTVSGVDYGIQAFYAWRLAIFNVDVMNCGYDGVLLQFANDTRVTNSLFESNGFANVSFGGGWVTTWGLQASYSVGGVVSGNAFLRNEGGLDFNVSNGFLIYHNTFTNNTQQAWENSGPNYWNASYPISGNNWSNYRGWDDCRGPLQDNCTRGDGIGDLPYQVSTIAVDHYPLLAVNPPKIPPIVIANIMPGSVVTAGNPLYFSASASYDPMGWPLLAYSWEFGDGFTSNLSSTAHVYEISGTYVVHLTVTSMRHLSSVTTVNVIVLPPPTLDLVTYASPRGYIVPVPRAWSRQYNVTAGNTTMELLLQGEVNGTRANMIVDTEAVAGVQETQSYMEEAIQGILQGIRSSYPDAFINGTTAYIQVSGHLAATFEVSYGAHPLFQDVLLVLSQAHGEEWTIVLTGGTGAFPTLHATFVKIVAGFVITLAPPASGGGTGVPQAISMAVLIAGPVLLVIVALVLLLLGRRPRGALSFPPGPQFCPRCGEPRGSAARFCGRCGLPMTSEISSEPRGPAPPTF